MTTIHDGSRFKYTPCYSEENVYWLCDELIKDGSAQETELFVVFISNESKHMSMFHHKDVDGEVGEVLLDFHVFCVQIKTETREYLVWDLDSDLPMPQKLSEYVSECIKIDYEHELLGEFERICRVVHAPMFLEHFTSNRTHMQNSTSIPPDDEITPKDGTTKLNLDLYTTMQNCDVSKFIEENSSKKVLTEQLGVLVDAKKLVCFFSLISHIMSWVESQQSSENSDVSKKQASGNEETATEKILPEPDNKDVEIVTSLKIQIGRICEVSEHPSANGYFVKKIKIGESKELQVVSRVGSPSLTNCLVVLITNVKSAMIHGVRSEGLVLCASDADHHPEPLIVPEEAKIGECVTFAGHVAKSKDTLNPKKQRIGKILLPHLSTDAHGMARFKGVLFMTYGGPCTSTIHDGKVTC